MLTAERDRLRKEGKTDKEIAKISFSQCPDNSVFGTPEDVKEEFINTADNGPGVLARVDIKDLLYPELKKKAKEFGLKASGKKDELVARIVAHLKKEGK